MAHEHSGGGSMERENTPEAGPMGQEVRRDEGEPAGKKRRLLCEFSSVASCSVSVARRCLAENDWEMEVRSPFLLRSFPGAARARSPFPVSVFQRALNAYFEPQVEEDALKRCPETASEPGTW